MNNMIKNAGRALLMVLLLTSCSQFTDDTSPYSVPEAVKNVSGVWTLKNVTRNDIDITSDMDFSKFELHITNDGRYHIENYLPFVVEKDGTWATDDPLYPYQLSFHEDGAANSVNVNFNFPVVNGQRTLLITLSPGCASNVYTYVLERKNNP